MSTLALILVVVLAAVVLALAILFFILRALGVELTRFSIGCGVPPRNAEKSFGPIRLMDLDLGAVLNRFSPGQTIEVHLPGTPDVGVMLVRVGRTTDITANALVEAEDRLRIILKPHLVVKEGWKSAATDNEICSLTIRGEFDPESLEPLIRSLLSACGVGDSDLVEGLAPPGN